MLSNNELEFLKELKSNKSYPFTQDIEEDIYNFTLELKNRQLIQIEDYYISIVNHQAIDEIINSKTLDYLTVQNQIQNHNKYPAKTNRIKRIISMIMLLSAIAGIISLVLEIIRSKE